jgi:hypothetical protein
VRGKREIQLDPTHFSVRKIGPMKYKNIIINDNLAFMFQSGDKINAYKKRAP